MGKTYTDFSQLSKGMFRKSALVEEIKPLPKTNAVGGDDALSFFGLNVPETPTGASAGGAGDGRILALEADVRAVRAESAALEAAKAEAEREAGDLERKLAAERQMREAAEAERERLRGEAMRQGLSVGKYFMFNAAVASETVDGTLQNANAAVKSKYVPSDWSDYDAQSWAANWHKWFNNDATDSRGKMGWPDYFSTALSNATTVYNYYSSGDPVFIEEDVVPGVTTGVFHWPTLNLTWPFIQWEITAEANCWQKQETHKGVEPIAGTLRGGWGFNCWYETVGGEPVQMYYTAAQANAMVANGSITNSPVFSYGGTPLNNRNASQDDIWLSLAKYVPAISSPIGGTATLDANNINLDDATIITRPNGWGRDHSVYEESWLHSDMKDVAYFYVYKLYEQLVTRGDMQ